MLTTTSTPVKIRLPTYITIAGSHHQQIVYIQFNPPNISSLGWAYTIPFRNPLTQTTNPTVLIPQVHPTKGLTSRRSGKMAWATTLLQDQDTLSAYEEYARESAYEVDDSQPSPSTNHRRTQPRAAHQGTTKDTQWSSANPTDFSPYTIGS